MGDLLLQIVMSFPSLFRFVSLSFNFSSPCLVCNNWFTIEVNSWCVFLCVSFIESGMEGPSLFSWVILPPIWGTHRKTNNSTMKLPLLGDAIEHPGLFYVFNKSWEDWFPYVHLVRNSLTMLLVCIKSLRFCFNNTLSLIPVLIILHFLTRKYARFDTREVCLHASTSEGCKWR